jgi:hypothetical protein
VIGETMACPEKRKSGPPPKPKRVSFTKTDKPGAYVTETEYDNSGDGPYKSPSTGIHLPGEDPADTLAAAFGKIDADPSLDDKEKRRAKAKAAMKSKK